jgi:hypothetical protein
VQLVFVEAAQLIQPSQLAGQVLNIAEEKLTAKQRDKKAQRKGRYQRTGALYKNSEVRQALSLLPSDQRHVFRQNAKGWIRKLDFATAARSFFSEYGFGGGDVIEIFLRRCSQGT